MPRQLTSGLSAASSLSLRSTSHFSKVRGRFLSYRRSLGCWDAPRSNLGQVWPRTRSLTLSSGLTSRSTICAILYLQIRSMTKGWTCCAKCLNMSPLEESRRDRLFSILTSQIDNSISTNTIYVMKIKEKRASRYVKERL